MPAVRGSELFDRATIRHTALSVRIFLSSIRLAPANKYLQTSYVKWPSAREKNETILAIALTVRPLEPRNF
jgi:hypothetical protein